MQLDALKVPTFPRLDEYAGLWLAEKYYFLQHWLFLQRMDFAAHMNAAQPGRSSSLDMVAGKGGSRSR
jgi:hypothetical protein